MKKCIFGRSGIVPVFFRLVLITIITLSLALGGLALHTEPAHAVFDIAPANVTIDAQECIPFVDTQITVTCCTCSNPPNSIFFWLIDTGGGIPAWITLDENTGAISGCPPKPSAGAYTFGVQVSELCVCPPSCGILDCLLNLPCATISPTMATVTINVAASDPLPCVTQIDPVFYPVAWEGLPFSMTLTCTGGVGPFTWTVVDLPSGISVTDAANGVVSGTPDPGTCGIYIATATVTDAGTCPDASCCPDISRPFLFIVDCLANYPSIFYSSSGCNFNVQIGPGLTQGQANVFVDSVHEATLVGGQSQGFTSVPCESHLVSVDQTVQSPDPNTRFSVMGSNIATVTDTNNLAYFDYAREVNITTGSSPSGLTSPPGAGFHAVGSFFSSTAPGTVETDIQAGKKYVFKQWRLPDGTTRPTRDLSFVVNQGGAVIAEYDTYYQLTLHSEYPPINETSFELANSTATWNLSLHAVPMQGFWGFLGATQSPVNASGQQVMTGPSTVEIQWRYNYTMPIVAIVILLLVIVGLIFLIRWLRSKPAAKTEPTKAVTTTKKEVTRRRKTR